LRVSITKQAFHLERLGCQPVGRGQRFGGDASKKCVDGCTWVPGDPLGYIKRGHGRCILGEHVDETPLDKGDAIDLVAGEHHLERCAAADQMRQALGSASAGDQAEAQRGEPEPRVRARDS
jgi:hypothetical protein